MSGNTSIGLIGLGLLGQALAQRLAGAGFAFARLRHRPGQDRQRCQNSAAEPASSIAESSARAAPIMLAVFSTDQVEEVVERELLPALGDGSQRIVLCASTCDPDRIAALAERVTPRGCGSSKRRCPARAARWRAARASA